MRRRAWLSCVGLTAIFVSLVGCGKSEGTFVLLKLTGSVNGSIQRIEAKLTFAGGAFDTAIFKKPAGEASITLPTEASLKIRNGDGHFTVLVRAFDAEAGGNELAAVSKAGEVKRNQTTVVELALGAPAADGGIDGRGEPIDSGVLGVDTSSSDRVPLDTGVIDQAIDVGGDADGPYVAVDTAMVDAPMGGAIGTGGVVGGGTGGATILGTGGIVTATDGGSGGSTGTGGGTGTGGSLGGSIGTGGGIGTGGSTGGNLDAGSTPTYVLTVNPATRDFGIVLPGSSSSALSFTVTNAGDATTPPLTLSVSAPAPFATSQDLCSGKTLAPGVTCTVTFTFSPTAAGGAQADGSVGPTGGTAAVFTMTGAGSSATAELSFTPSALNFGTVDVGTPKSLDLTLRNIGSADAGTITVPPSGSAPFTITKDGCSGLPLVAQAQCVVTVTFTPTVFGPATTTINAGSTSGLMVNAVASGTGRDYLDMTVSFLGTGTGSVAVAGGSGPAIKTCPSTGSPCVVRIPRTAEQASVILTETPGPTTSYFNGWSGACEGTTNKCSLDISAATSVGAEFTHRKYTLSVTKNETGGTGKVTATAVGIDCGSTCSAQVLQGSSVTLIAVPDAGAGLVGWSGGGCSGTGNCVVTVSATTTVTATFGVAQHALTVNVSGAGTVTSVGNAISCPGTCLASFAHNTTVYLTASSIAEYVFAGWSGGGCTGTGTCAVTMTAATTVTAPFVIPLTCSYDDGAACTKVSYEKNLGALSGPECRSLCGVHLKAQGLSNGCWVLAGATCYCRDGNRIAGTAAGGSCS